LHGLTSIRGTCFRSKHNPFWMKDFVF
jgi:hypothetical protein